MLWQSLVISFKNFFFLFVIIVDFWDIVFWGLNLDVKWCWLCVGDMYINEDPNLSCYRIILLIVKQLGYTGVDNDDIILKVDGCGN